MNTTIEFMAPRLVGKRFDGHAIPFEVLKNLAVLEDLVIEAAKWKYLEATPDRQRVPRGFTDGVSLQLKEVRDGSVIPVIMLTLLTTTPLIPEMGSPLSYFEQGRDAILDTVSAADAQTQNANTLPSHLLGYFDQLGRTLRDDEALELDPKNTARPARLTKETRRRILLQSDKIKELTEEVILRGTVPEMDQEKMSFEFQLVSGPRIKAPLEPQYLDSILEAFNGYRNNRKIMISGIGRYNRNEKLLSINSVEHASILEDLDPGARLEEFKTLRNGWLDGKGIAPAPKDLDWLIDAFQSHYPDGVPLPYLYPTAEGGVQAEWSLKGWEISLEIDVDQHQGQWHALDMSNEQEEEKTLNLNEPADWQCLAKEINQRTRGDA
jgi:hypothetical protein